MPQDLPHELGAVIAGKYRLDAVLGAGGMGAVYLATNTAIGRKVALKVLVRSLAQREDVKRRFELEARAAAVISHPGIVDVLDMGETADGAPFIVMEYLEGASLRALLKPLGTLSAAQAVAVIAPVLDALAAAHLAGVIHRDVKPANIFVCVRPQRTIKLLDFGVSRFGGASGLTSTGTAVGTPKYMAPEQVLGAKDLGPPADLYSVGAVLYHLLAGHPPHEADSDMAALARTLTEEHQPLHELRPDLPQALCAEIDALLARDPQRRPGDATQVRARLSALVPSDDNLALFAAAASSRPRIPPASTPSHGVALPHAGPRATSAPSLQRPGNRIALDAPKPQPWRAPARIGTIVTVALLAGAALAYRLSRPMAAPAAIETPATAATPATVTSPATPAPPPTSDAPATLVRSDESPAAPPSTSTPPAPDAGRGVAKRRPSRLDLQERNPYR